MTGKDRREAKRLIAQRQAQQLAEQPTPRSADLPAIETHPAAPPLDVQALGAPIELSPNLGQSIKPQRQRNQPKQYSEPLEPRRPQAPHAQPSTLSNHQYVALRLLEALIRRDGEDALGDGVVKGCIRAAERILR